MPIILDVFSSEYIFKDMEVFYVNYDWTFLTRLIVPNLTKSQTMGIIETCNWTVIVKMAHIHYKTYIYLVHMDEL